MALQFTISPDLNANQLSPWFLFNTQLQHYLGDACHFELFDSFEKLRQSMMEDHIDIIFANAFDTAILVRQKGFVPVAQGMQGSDEALIAVKAEDAIHSLKDLSPGCQIACTDAPDIEMIGRILLEPSDLSFHDLKLLRQQSYVLVAKEILRGGAQAGFFLKRSYDELSELVRSGLRPVAESHIYVVRHALLVSPRLAARVPALLKSLSSMNGTPLAEELGLGEGWKPMTMEEAEFMIDLMDTLVQE